MVVKEKIFNILLYTAVIICMIFLFYRNIRLTNTISFEQELSLIYKTKIEEILKENDIQQKTIGKKIEITKFVNISGVNINKIFKILIFVEQASCKPCYDASISFYKNKLKDKTNEIQLIVLLSSRNIKYAERLLSKFPNNLIKLIDNKMNFMNLLNIKGTEINKTIVMLLNNENVCLYSYLVDDKFLMKDSERFSIIENYLYNK